MTVRDNSYGIAELQDKMLDIFKYFDSLCAKHNLTYWAGAGTCLGAIRHGGFIPWDDDLDVYMPRSDYEKLWRIWNQISLDGKYRLCRTSLKKNYHHRVIQVVDTSTTFINERCVNEDIEHGVYIDVIPIDVAAPCKPKRLLQIFYTILYSVYNIQAVPEFHGTGLMIQGTKFLLWLIQKPELRYKIWKYAEKKMTQYVITEGTDMYVDLLTYFKMLFKPMPVAWFEPKRVPFEDTEICVPKEYEKYLRYYYGNYMELPPLEKRLVQHNTVFIDLKTPYTTYKGVYYCRNT